MHLSSIKHLNIEKEDNELIPSHMLVKSFAREFKLLESIGKVIIN